MLGSVNFLLLADVGMYLLLRRSSSAMGGLRSWKYTLVVEDEPFLVDYIRKRSTKSTFVHANVNFTSLRLPDRGRILSVHPT